MEWGESGKATYPQQVDALKSLARDDSDELHFGQEGDLGMGQARRERERHDCRNGADSAWKCHLFMFLFGQLLRQAVADGEMANSRKLVVGQGSERRGRFRRRGAEPNCELRWVGGTDVAAWFFGGLAFYRAEAGARLR